MPLWTSCWICINQEVLWYMEKVTENFFFNQYDELWFLPLAITSCWIWDWDCQEWWFHHYLLLSSCILFSIQWWKAIKSVFITRNTLYKSLQNVRISIAGLRNKREKRTASLVQARRLFWTFRKAFCRGGGACRTWEVETSFDFSRYTDKAWIQKEITWRYNLNNRRKHSTQKLLTSEVKMTQ